MSITFYDEKKFEKYDEEGIKILILRFLQINYRFGS